MSAQIEPGDEIVVTDVDHESNIGCWRRLAEARGAIVREWKVDADTLTLRLEDLRAPAQRRYQPRLLHASVEPRRQRARRRRHHAPGARARRARLRRRRGLRAASADRRARLGRRLLRVQRLQDLRPAPGVPVRQARAARGPERHQPLLHRGRALQAAARARALRMVHALSAVVDYLESLDFAAVAAHERALAARLLEFLDGKKNVRVLGERTASATRLPTISFTVDGAGAAEIVRAVDAAAHRHQARRLLRAPPRRSPRPRPARRRRARVDGALQQPRRNGSAVRRARG